MNTIYIGNLPFRATENSIEAFFAPYGAIENVVLIKDRETGRSKGFGFVTFNSDDSANKALEKNGQEFEGRTLKVNIARPKREDERGGDRGDRGGRQR